MLYLSILVNVMGKYSLLHFPRDQEKDVRRIKYQFVLLYIELWARSELCACAGCLGDKPSSAVIFCGVLRFFNSSNIHYCIFSALLT